jgi:hypothetical protein
MSPRNMAITTQEIIIVKPVMRTTLIMKMNIMMLTVMK